MKTIIIPLDFSEQSLTGLNLAFMLVKICSSKILLLTIFAHQIINKAFIPVLSFPIYHLRITAEDIWTLGAFNP